MEVVVVVGGGVLVASSFTRKERCLCNACI